jgi:lysophospholipase L1-like esterase
MKIAITLLSVLTLASVSFGKEPITIFLAGDSTMAEKLPERRPETGWGEALQQLFDESKVKIENLAQNGRSSKSFIAENRWQALVARLKQANYVFIQFGHNDESKDKGDRYSTPEEFRNNLVRFVSEVRERKRFRYY